VPEVAICSQPRAAGGGEFVPSACCVAPTLEQPIPFAAVQHIVQERVACGLFTQPTDLPSSRAEAKPAAVHRVEDCELDKPERFPLHALSLWQSDPRLIRVLHGHWLRRSVEGSPVGPWEVAAASNTSTRRRRTPPPGRGGRLSSGGEAARGG
jgi:hypothetical protein